MKLEVSRDQNKLESSNLKTEEESEELPEEFVKKKIKFEGYVSYPARPWELFQHDSKKHFLKRYYSQQLKKCDFRIADFKVLYTIGVNALSRVLLTKWKESKMVAIKVREKKTIVQKELVSQTKREIRLLNFVKFPFVMNACVIQCNLYLYYIMSFACGNSLEHLTQTYILTENQAKFYSSQITLALEYLHSIGVIHRAIEASNILICHDGYVKLTGFSKAKIGLGKYKSLTNFESLYTIPDTLNEKHGHLYDLWCFGVLVYYLCSSEHPFLDSNSDKYIEETKPIKTPEYFSRNLRDLIHRLLDCNMCCRLGAKCPSEIRQHAWFDMPWSEIENKRLRPPFVPRCKYPIKYFHSFPTEPLEQSSFDPYHNIFEDCFSNHS